jgi:G:T-mismatch repair DNA endonuclease (very short patch repair protein)
LEKYTAAEVRREKRREQRLRALGYRVERVSWEDVLGRWPNTRQWLRAALAEQRRLGT